MMGVIEILQHQSEMPTYSVSGLRGQMPLGTASERATKVELGIFSQHDIGDNAGIRAHFRCLPPISLDIVFDSCRIRRLTFPHFYHLLKNHRELIRAIVGRNQGFLYRPTAAYRRCLKSQNPFSCRSH
jgi:hypothetical protein